MHKELSQYSISENPLETFLNWYEEAKINCEDNPEAMTLATIDSNTLRPKTRTVLYKGLVDNKILFYTNYLSNKGKDIEKNNEVSLLFYWHKSIRQIRIQGKVVKASSELSNKYFLSRDRESQLASYISAQSSPIESKLVLIEKLTKAQSTFTDKIIPRPEHWGGYLVEAYEFEFFIYGKNRLNDRFLFEKKLDGWSVSRLQP